MRTLVGWFCVLWLAGCGGVAPAVEPKAPASEPDAAIIARSSELLAAFDRGDAAAVEQALASTFWHFEGGKPVDRAATLTQLRQRKPGAPLFAKRTWDVTFVRKAQNEATFIGKALEIQGGNDVKGGYHYVGWYLMHWVHGAQGWQLDLWTWQRAGQQSERDTWNEIYRNGVGFSQQPNQLLVQTVAGRKPGTVLDLAMGQGRNALYLASQGWTVTGVDIADEGLQLARTTAAQRGLRLEALNVDIDQYDFGTQRWDLVTMIYATEKRAWLEKIKPSLKPGGLVVVEYFAREPGSDEGFAAGELAALFGNGFEIIHDQVVEDAPDWAMDRARLVRFVARKMP